MAQHDLPPDLERKLDNLECPFKWVQGLNKTDLGSAEHDFHDKVKEKLDTSDDSDFLEYGFPSGVCLIYEYIVTGKPCDTVKEIIDSCETKLNSVFKNKRNHSLIRKAKVAYLHVLQSCKAFFQLYFGNIESLKDILKGVPDNKRFNQDVQACINGIKAAFLLTYGPYKTTEIGIQCARTAVELDSTEGWYYFLVGKGLYRHRRAVKRNHAPTEEEIDFMETAKQMEFKYEETVMFLIEMYSEMIEKGEKRENYFDNTVQLCRDIYGRNTDWYCLWRCCRGLLRLEIRYIDVDLMQRCLEKANELSPNNPDILYTMCKFYEKKNNLWNASHYANLAVEHGKGAPRFVSTALMLKRRIDRLVDLTPTFDEYISSTQTAFNKHVTMCMKARYLLQEKRNSVREVLNIFAQVLEEDPGCLLPEKQKVAKELYSLMAVLFNEIQSAVRKIAHNSEDKNYCESRLTELKRLHPMLMESILPFKPERNWWNTYSS